MTKRELINLLEDYHPNEVIKLIIKDSRDRCSLLPVEIVGVNNDATSQTGFLTLDLDYSFATDTTIETEIDKERRRRLRQDDEAARAAMRLRGWEEPVKKVIIMERPTTAQERQAAIEQRDAIREEVNISELTSEKKAIVKEVSTAKRGRKRGSGDYRVPKDMTTFKKRIID